MDLISDLDGKLADFLGNPRMESGNGMINQGMGEMGKCWEFQLLFFSNCKTSELDTWKYLEDQLLDRK